MAISRLTELVGRVLGNRYRLVAPIGSGASAQVFLADDVVLRRRVAVKVLHPALADDDAFLRRFRGEARAAAALSHPNLMAVFDWGEDDGPYLVLEFLGGGSLRAMLDRGRRLTPSQAVVVALDAARALAFAHQRGFVHRDIKPANLLFGDDGRLRIADFGLARALSEAAWTEPGETMVGTARYAAPEQVGGGRLDGKADVYALGLVVIEAVTGSVPLVADTPLGTMLGRLDTAVPVDGTLGPLVPILTRVGQPAPAERPTAEEFGRSLMAAARQLERPAPLPLPGVLDPVSGITVSAADPTLLPPPGAAGSTGARTASDGNGARTPFVITSAAEPRPDDPRPSRRRPRRRWPKALAALVVLAALGSGGAYAWVEARPPRADVPGVERLPLGEARRALAGAQRGAEDGLSWEVKVDPRYDNGIESGNVISQVPAAGESLVDGGIVRLVVSRGPPPTDLRPLADLTEADARAELARAELRPGAVTAAPSEDVEAGRVLDWSATGRPRPTTLPEGTEVDLVVSSGPAPRVVDDYVGRPAAEVVADLEAKRLPPSTTEEFSDERPAGEVIRTEPPAGTEVARDTPVAVVVSLGQDLVTVPDIAGLTLQEAVDALVAAGLEPDQVVGPATGAAFGTDLAAGEQVTRGTSVDVLMRRRPAPTTTTPP